VLIDDMSHTLVVHSDGSIVHADGSVMYADSGNVIETSTVHTVSADSGIPSQSSQSYISEKGECQLQVRGRPDVQHVVQGEVINIIYCLFAACTESDDLDVKILSVRKSVTRSYFLFLK